MINYTSFLAHMVLLFFIEYFKCTINGNFIDSLMHTQGKYFQCVKTSECKLQ